MTTVPVVPGSVAIDQAVTARSRTREGGDVAEPIDWDLALRIARRVAGRDSLAGSQLGESLRRDFEEVSAEAEALVTEFTGLRPPGPAQALVLDRSGWVEANVASMRRLLAPLTDKLGERVAKSPLAPVGRSVAGAELGVLLGWVAKRVLGQYDLLVPDDGDSGTKSRSDDAVYFVGVNVVALEQRHAFRPRDFRMWIALHELTHRAQFTGVPWLRPYFLSLVEQSLSLVEPDPRRFMRVVGRITDDVRKGRNPLDAGGLVGLIATPEQQVLLDRVQALMSLLEGHGNLVMNHLGRDHVAGQARMARILHARRHAGGLSAVVQKLLGFELKMRQYEIGERFCEAVVREAGLRAIDLAWRDSESLPTLPEMAAPDEWLRRVGA